MHEASRPLAKAHEVDLHVARQHLLPGELALGHIPLNRGYGPSTWRGWLRTRCSQPLPPVKIRKRMKADERIVSLCQVEAGILCLTSRNPNRSRHFRVDLAAPAICRLRLLSSTFVDSRPFSSYASAMTLTMALATNDCPSLRIENPRRARERRPQQWNSSKRRTLLVRCDDGPVGHGSQERDENSRSNLLLPKRMLIAASNRDPATNKHLEFCWPDA
jgi:hypothetical protein